MQEAPPDEVTELFAAFDPNGDLQQEQRALRLAATLSPALAPPVEHVQSGSRGPYSLSRSST